MEKEQFKLQIYQNRFIRNTIAASIRLLIYTIMQAALYILIWIIVAKGVKNVSTTEHAILVLTIINVIVVFIALMFFWLWVLEIKALLKQHKQLSSKENKFFDTDSIWE